MIVMTKLVIVSVLQSLKPLDESFFVNLNEIEVLFNLPWSVGFVIFACQRIINKKKTKIKNFKYI